MLICDFKQSISGSVFTKLGKVKILEVIIVQGAKRANDFNNGATALVLISLESYVLKLRKCVGNVSAAALEVISIL